MTLTRQRHTFEHPWRALTSPRAALARHDEEQVQVAENEWRRYRLSAVCQPATASRLTLLETFQIVRENGGEGQNRTVDTTIFSRMLYQLSYLATLITGGHLRPPRAPLRPPQAIEALPRRPGIITTNRRRAQCAGPWCSSSGLNAGIDVGRQHVGGRPMCAI